MHKKSNKTIRDIAREANVSVATVSRVLNDSQRVSQKTKERVQHIIEKHSFRPNALARGLYTKETKVIGCVLPDITNYYFAKMFLALEKSAHQRGYTLLLCNSMNDLQLESLYLTTLVDQQVDGILFMGGRTNETKPDKKYVEEVKEISSCLPFVIINGTIDADHVYEIATDESHAMEKMMHFLVERNHSSITFVGGMEGVTVTDEKVSVLYRTAEKYGLNKEKISIKTGGFFSKDGYKIGKELILNDELPEAIIAINDEVAIGFVHACHEKGFSIPQDISIMGYDNVSIGENMYPTLTTFSHAYDVIASTALETMHCLIHKKEAPQKQIISGKMVRRESVR